MPLRLCRTVAFHANFIQGSGDNPSLRIAISTKEFTNAS